MIAGNSGTPVPLLPSHPFSDTGFVVSIDDSLKARTDRDFARLDLCYTGILISSDFTPSHEVSQYGFFTLDNLPLLRKNQLFLIKLATDLKNKN